MEVTVKETNKPKKNKGAAFKRTTRFLYSQRGWLFILPALALMAVFTFYPIVNALVTAFLNNYKGLTGKYDGFGIENFKTVITGNVGGAEFVNCLVNTLLFAAISVPVSTLLALFISVALNSIKALRKVFQTIFFLPYLTSALAMGAVFASFFKVIGTGSMVDSPGLFNNFLILIGAKPINWINISAYGSPFNPWAGRFVVILYSVWAGLPFKILILFSALQGVSKQYYDAAKIDGASKNTVLWKITVPLISPMISYLVITGFMGGLKAYSSIVGIFGQYMGPNNSYEMGTMVGYIYACISKGATGLAAAGSLILFAIIMCVTAVNLYVSKKRVHY